MVRWSGWAGQGRMAICFQGSREQTAYPSTSLPHYLHTSHPPSCLLSTSPTPSLPTYISTYLLPPSLGSYVCTYVLPTNHRPPPPHTHAHLPSLPTCLPLSLSLTPLPTNLPNFLCPKGAVCLYYVRMNICHQHDGHMYQPGFEPATS